MLELLSHPLVISFLVSAAVLAIIPAVMCNYLIFLERKIAAWMQMRIGPNRVGPWGLFQPIADGLKFFFKEQVIPDHVNRWLYIIAPGIAVTTAFLAFAVVPFGATSPDPGEFQWVVAPGVNIGILYLFAVTSLAVYAILLGGWASNNKYSFLGALRSSAQVISYEIPLGMSILGVILICGSLNLEDIIHYQASRGILGWNVWYQPLAFLIFFVAAMAETNRLPFDLPECEQELIGGYHTEYSAMKLAFFFLGEYTHMITVSLLVALLFLGGWHFPGIATMGPNTVVTVAIKFVVLFSKMGMFILLMMFIRWTIPRFRFDQLMTLAWTTLIPLALGNFVLVMFAKQFQWPLWILSIGSVVLFLIPGYYGAKMSSNEKSPRLEPVPVTE